MPRRLDTRHAGVPMFPSMNVPVSVGKDAGYGSIICPQASQPVYNNYVVDLTSQLSPVQPGCLLWKNASTIICEANECSGSEVVHISTSETPFQCKQEEAIYYCGDGVCENYEAKLVKMVKSSRSHVHYLTKQDLTAITAEKTFCRGTIVNFSCQMRILCIRGAVYRRRVTGRCW